MERIYVRERVYAPFLEAFVQEVRRFKLGHPSDEATYIGPLCRGEAALAELEAQVGDAWRACRRAASVRPGRYPRLPWTGRKHSGIGTTLSILGIEAFVQPKAWHIRRG